MWQGVVSFRQSEVYTSAQAHAPYGPAREPMATRGLYVRLATYRPSLIHRSYSHVQSAY